MAPGVEEAAGTAAAARTSPVGTAPGSSPTSVGQPSLGPILFQKFIVFFFRFLVFTYFFVFLLHRKKSTQSPVKTLQGTEKDIQRLPGTEVRNGQKNGIFEEKQRFSMQPRSQHGFKHVFIPFVSLRFQETCFNKTTF